MHLFSRIIDFAYFYDFSIEIWDCFDIVVFLLFNFFYSFCVFARVFGLSMVLSIQFSLTFGYQMQEDIPYSKENEYNRKQYSNYEPIKSQELY